MYMSIFVDTQFFYINGSQMFINTNTEDVYIFM